MSQNIFGQPPETLAAFALDAGGHRTARMIGTMDETRTVRVTRADVREALMWALERDRTALLTHRAAVHATKSDLARRRADKALVEQWRARTPDAEQDSAPAE
jgi:hypothetical protein